MLHFLRAKPELPSFDALIANRGARWFGACLRITRRAALAEEAVQEALLKAWRHRDAYRGEAELDTWIHRIAVNTAIDLIRRERLDWTDELPDEAAPPAHSAALAKDLDAALQHLSALERLAFVLKHCEDWSLAEISTHLGCSIDSVKQALFRGVRKLRAALAEWRGEP
jgi:RNA polymerase sigma-70 factor (ECF subfamily)